jgi:hypothetical protein
MHRAGPILYDRKHGERRSIYVARGAVSVTGTITPGALAGCLDPGAVEAGLAARLLPAMPPRKPKRWTEAVTDPATRRAYARLLEGLSALTTQADGSPQKLRLTDEARAAWVAHYDAWGHRQAGADGEDAALLSKLEGAAARLALVHYVCESVARGEKAEGPVGLESVEAGIALAKWFYAESCRIYAALRESSGERQTRRLVEFMRQHGGRMTVRQLMRANSRRYPDSATAEAALQGLVDAGLAAWEDAPPGPKGGQSARPCVLCMTHDSTDTTDDGGEDGGDGCPTVPPDSTPPARENPEENEGSVGTVMRHAQSAATQNGPTTAAGVDKPDEVVSDAGPEPTPERGDAWEPADTHKVFND